MNKKQNTDWEKKYIAVPDWIYLGSGKVVLRYEDPNGELMESEFYPMDYPEIETEQVKRIKQTLAKSQLELIERVDQKLLKAFPPRDKTNVYALCALDVFLRILNELKKEIEGE